MKSRLFLLFALVLACFGAQAAGFDLQAFASSHADVLGALSAVGIAGAVKSQGTQLYFIDPADDTVVEVACITELTGLSQSRDQIDTTCLSDNERSFEAGLASPGVANFGIYTDPAEASHVRLQQLAVAGTTVNWAAGWSDGTVAPTADSGGVFDQTPVARTFLYFSGYISDFPFDFAQNAVVASNLGIQTSGPTVWIPRT